MYQEIKDQWIKDLRDGTRTQGVGSLRDKKGNQCCLDVLCEQAVREGAISAPQLNYNGYYYVYQGTVKEGSLLPSPVMRWAGLTSSDPQVMYHTDEDEWSTLSTLNDDLGKSFEEIADLIEATKDL